MQQFEALAHVLVQPLDHHVDSEPGSMVTLGGGEGMGGQVELGQPILTSAALHHRNSASAGHRLHARRTGRSISLLRPAAGRVIAADRPAPCRRGPAGPDARDLSSALPAPSSARWLARRWGAPDCSSASSRVGAARAASAVSSAGSARVPGGPPPAPARARRSVSVSSADPRAFRPAYPGSIAPSSAPRPALNRARSDPPLATPFHADEIGDTPGRPGTIGSRRVSRQGSGPRPEPRLDVTGGHPETGVRLAGQGRCRRVGRMLPRPSPAPQAGRDGDGRVASASRRSPALPAL